MSPYVRKNVCIECENSIDNNVFDYSISKYGIPLCRDCQDWFLEMREEATPESLVLYFALRLRGVPAELEKFDGFKTIDIAVVEAKVNIEVDGGQHSFNPKQALSDLRRTYYSFKKGYLTLRIPNSLVKHHLEETAELITEVLNLANYKNYSRHSRKRW